MISHARMNTRTLLRPTTDELLHLYTELHLTCQEIGDRYKVSRSSVSKWLKRAGIDTQEGERADVTCTYCGARFSVHRKRLRTAQRLYCTQEHYIAAMRNGSYYQHRQGQRIARDLVARYYPALTRSNVVHHKDGNNDNNDLSNLALFADQAEHMRFHRSGKGSFLWDGAAKF